MILEPDASGQRVVVAHGYSADESSVLTAEYVALKPDAPIESFAKKRDVAIINLKSSNAPPATLFISPRSSSASRRPLLDPLLREELRHGWCAARASRGNQGPAEETASAGASLMQASPKPGHGPPGRRYAKFDHLTLRARDR
jgi:hypothetical protein